MGNRFELRNAHGDLLLVVSGAIPALRAAHGLAASSGVDIDVVHVECVIRCTPSGAYMSYDDATGEWRNV